MPKGILWAVLQSPLPVQPLYSEGSAHHCTLLYGVECSTVEHLIGLPMTIALTSIAHNDRVQAIKCILPTWAPCDRPHPHITVSWSHGAQPVESNVMLMGEHKESPIEVDHAHCVIEFLEWGNLQAAPRKWSDRPKVQCPTCQRQGIETWTRSLTGYCRKHRNA